MGSEIKRVGILTQSNRLLFKSNEQIPTQEMTVIIYREDNFKEQAENILREQGIK